MDAERVDDQDQAHVGLVVEGPRRHADQSLCEIHGSSESTSSIEECKHTPGRSSLRRHHLRTDPFIVSGCVYTEATSPMQLSDATSSTVPVLLYYTSDASGDGKNDKSEMTIDREVSE